MHVRDRHTPAAPSDSADNTWQTALPAFGANEQPSTIKLFYAFAPATSATHTFTDPGDDYLSIAVIAFAGAQASSDPLDRGTGSAGDQPLATGSVTPSQAGELVTTFACSGDSIATAITIGSGFTLVDHLLDGSGGDPEDMASAMLVAPDTAPVDPTWAFPGDTKVAAMIATFRE